jgi:hypothetical protein
MLYPPSSLHHDRPARWLRILRSFVRGALLGALLLMPAAASPAAASPMDIAVVGDSLANDLGRGMEDLFRGKRNVKVIKQTHHATGLTRPDYFNWNTELREFVGKSDADAIVVLIGGNDAQAIRVKGRSLERFSKPWLAEYERRVAHFMKILKRARTRVYWVGLPVVRSDSMSRHFQAMNRIYRRQAARHRIKYVSIWRDFADAGGDYTSFGRGVNGVKRQLRKNDGLHFTDEGTLRLAASVARAIGVR